MIVFVYFVFFSRVLSLACYGSVVSTSASNGLERFVSEVSDL